MRLYKAYHDMFRRRAKGRENKADGSGRKKDRKMGVGGKEGLSHVNESL